MPHLERHGTIGKVEEADGAAVDDGSGGMDSASGNRVVREGAIKDSASNSYKVAISIQTCSDMEYLDSKFQKKKLTQ